MSDKFGCDLKPKSNWIQVYPYGVTLGIDESRPVLIFKDASEKVVLPVWLSHQDAGLALSGSALNRRAGNSPHELSFKILEELGIKIEACFFVGFKGQHHLVEVKFAGSKKLSKLQVRADDAMSFCLRAGTKFYCTKDHTEVSRQMDVEIQQNKWVIPNVQAQIKKTLLN